MTVLLRQFYFIGLALLIGVGLFLSASMAQAAPLPATITDGLKAGGVNLVFDWYDVDTFNPTGFDAELPLIKAAGGGHVRLAISMDILENGSTGNLRDDRWNDLKKFVQKAMDNGLVTIIDVHNTGQKEPNSGTWTWNYMGRIDDAAVRTRHTSLLTQLAKRSYEELDRNWIVLTPGNEPLSDTWYTHQDQLMPKIRAACPDCAITALATNWQSMGTTMWSLQPKSKTWWDERFIIDVHMYAPGALTHCSFPGQANACPGKTWPGYYDEWLPVAGVKYAGTWNKQTLEAEFNKFWAWRTEQGNPFVHFSEIGTAADLADEPRGAYLNDLTSLLQTNGAGWSCWEWHKNFGIKNAPKSKAACLKGNTSTPVPTIDTQAPTTPTNLTATSLSSTQAFLNWSPATDNKAVVGYRVFRGGTQVGIAYTTSYTDSGLAAGTTYSYTVKAYDAAGNVSGNSNAATVTVQNPTTTGIFSVGERIVVSDGPVNVRSTANTTGTILGSQATNAAGTVAGGPTSQGGYTWWNINFDTGVDGWSVQNFLSKFVVSNDPPPTGIFTLGDRVRVVDGPLNIRESANTTANILGKLITDAQGKVVGGPVQQGGYTWWKVDFDSGVSGWGVQNHLAKITTTSPVPQDPVIPGQPNIIAAKATNDSSVAPGKNLSVSNAITADTSFTGVVLNVIYDDSNGGWKQIASKYTTNVKFKAGVPATLNNVLAVPENTPVGSYKVGIDVYDSNWKKLYGKGSSAVTISAQGVTIPEPEVVEDKEEVPVIPGQPNIIAAKATNDSSVAPGKNLSVSNAITADTNFTGIVQTIIYDDSNGGWKQIAAKYTTGVKFKAGVVATIKNSVAIPANTPAGTYKIGIDVFDAKWKKLYGKSASTVTIGSPATTPDPEETKPVNDVGTQNVDTFGSWSVTNPASVALGGKLSVQNTITPKNTLTGIVMNKIYTDANNWQMFAENQTGNVAFVAGKPVTVTNSITVPTNTPLGTHNVSLEIYDANWKNLLWKEAGKVTVTSQSAYLPSTSLAASAALAGNSEKLLQLQAKLLQLLQSFKTLSN